jgi:beta-glucosidase
VKSTDNRIGTAEDGQRFRSLRETLAGLRSLLDDGLVVRGYVQWSLLDNVEELLGARPKLEIAEVDRTTFARTAKPSRDWYAEARENFFTTA